MKQICNIISLNISNNAFIHELSILCYERKKVVLKNVGQNKINFGKTENTTQILTYKHHFMLCLFSFTCFLSNFFFLLKKQAYKLYLVSCASVSLLSCPWSLSLHESTTDINSLPTQLPLNQ